MPIDIIFISYDEPNADENYNKLVERFPYAKRVHGIEGIKNAHIAAAKKATTFTFYVVDGDTVVDNAFDFTYKPPEWDKEYVHIFQALNPATGDIYGYGGIKIFHKSMFKGLDDTMPVDFSTSTGAGVKYMDIVASTTHFNSDSFHAWRGAYREVSKLMVNKDDPETSARIIKWIDVPIEVSFSAEITIGLCMARQHFFDGLDINRVNDYDWLKQTFEKEGLNDLLG